jgi:probable phosphoglycerate mutase
MSRTDRPLSDLGKMHASKINLDSELDELELVACSPAIRAVETALLVCKGTILESLPFEIFPDLREMDFGLFEGKTHAQLRIDEPSFPSWYSDKKSAATPPGGETWAEAFARAESFLSTIYSRNCSTLIVSHGYQLRLLLVALLNLSHPSSMRRFELGNSCYSVVTRRSNNAWQLTKHNIGF